MLSRFPAYTLSTLRAESAELMQLVEIEGLGGSRDVQHSQYPGPGY